MKRFLLFLPMLIISTLANADSNIISDLASQKATRLELVQMRLDIMALDLTNKLDDKNIKGTEFEFDSFNPFMTKDNIGLEVRYHARSKYLNDSQCEIMKGVTNRMFKPSMFLNSFPKTMAENKKTEIEKITKFKTVLVDEDNKNLRLSCD